MKNAAIIAAAVLLLTAAACTKKEKDPVEVVFIKGVKHIQNPTEPINGKITLELEKVREINPFEKEDVGMRSFRAARSPQGEVILFDSSIIEAHYYGPDNVYLGNLVKKGQGPGEFEQYRGLSFHFMDEEIWAAGSQKVIRYDMNGTCLGEQRLGPIRGHGRKSSVRHRKASPAGSSRREGKRNSGGMGAE